MICASTQGEHDVLREKRRQIDEEGFTPGHDDEVNHHGSLARAAACYAWPQADHIERAEKVATPPTGWPWPAKWWKPKAYRRNLVRAAALLIAEIDRIDRLNRGR